MGRFKELLAEQEIIILDGAMGTELERRGCDLSGGLWSAKYLLEDPSLIRQLHQDYVRAGSDIVTTASYQAALPSLQAAGLSREAAESLLRETVDLARTAIETVWQELSEQERQQRVYPLVGGSVGPYAAYLADGSEYTGAYELSKADFQDFHRPRIRALLEAGSDLLAIETIPNGAEAAALMDLLREEFPQAEAYLSLTAQSTAALADGTPIEQVGALAAACPQILALGINCTAPQLIAPLLARLQAVSCKPLLAYPNSGEDYDADHQIWRRKPAGSPDLLAGSRIWQQAGLRLIGGCCRTGPEDIAALSRQFRQENKNSGTAF